MTIAFAGGGLDRADPIRSDPGRLAGLMTWRARLLRLDGLDPVPGEDGGLVWGTLADAAEDDELVFLGLDGERGCFAAVPASLSGSTAPPSPRLWAGMGAMGARDMATYAAARSLVDWHARHRFCARSGHPTVSAKGGWQRNCTDAACGAEHFPRVDPVTIMLVENDGRILLGRQPRYPARRFSALAGFLEPGEAIEDAVAREVLEEAGVRVRDVTYVASQPWPFPSSLMIACHALTDDSEIVIDANELDDARWFTRDEVAHAMTGADDGAFLAPPPYAVAHHLLKWWLESGR
jgi:NAD+ diphosphatase